MAERTRPRAGVIVTQVAFTWVAFAIAATTLWPIYESRALVVVVIAGLAVATVIAVAGAVLRWPGWVVLVANVAAFLLIGVPVAVPGAAAGGVLPTVDGLIELVTAVGLGWKQLLTITLPVADYEALLVPALVLVQVLASVSLAFALRTRAGEVAVLGPVILAIAGIALGSDTTPLATAVPIALTAAVLLWLVWFRWHRRQESIRMLLVAGTGDGGSRSGAEGTAREGIAAGGRTVVGAVLILAVSLVAATGAAVALPPSEDRTVARSAIVQPFDPRDYVSPLSAFRSYWQDDTVDSTLFTVEGVPEGGLIRLATLDTYDGVVFSVGSDRVSSASGTFVRVPSAIDRSGLDGPPVRATITVDGYSGVWLPTVGLIESATFSGPNAAARRDALFVNTLTGSAAVIGGIARPDSYDVAAIDPTQPPRSEWARLDPGSAVVPAASAVPDEVGTTLERWTAGVEGPGARLVAMLDGMAAEGYISHGVGQDEPASRSGHSADRIAELLSAPRMIGDAEQYAVTAALMAREIGFPSRVVLGFTVEDGVVRGGDVVAWIEVDTAQYGWVTIDPTPPVREIPEELPEDNAQVARPPTIVPPPAVETETIDRQNTPDSERDLPPDLDPVIQAVLAVLRVVGWVLLIGAIAVSPFLVIIAAKMRRRQLRRRAETPAARITGGWQEFADAVVDHGLAPAPTSTRTEVASVAGGVQALVLAAVADRAVFAPEEPAPSEADSVWRAVDDLRASLDEGRTRWQRLRARISLRSLGGYSVSKFLSRERRS